MAKNEELKHLYYLYGEEDYLKDQKKKEIVKKVGDLGGFVDTIRYKDQKVSGDTLKGQAYVTATLFGGPRFMLIENCSVTEPDVWIDYLKELEGSNTYVVVVDDKPDKRTKLYKAYAKYGEAIDLKTQMAKSLERFVMGWMGDNNMTMKTSELTYFINRVPDKMTAIVSELTKLRDYVNAGQASETVVITREDIDAITTRVIEDKIFEMIDRAAIGDSKGTYLLYNDLLTLKEPPSKILILLTRQINILLQIKDHVRLGTPNDEIASKMQVNRFVINKNLGVVKKLSYKRLLKLLDYGVTLQNESRNGTMSDSTAMDLMLAECFKE
ncbi:MAG: DNA polymerase III subunit delta [Lachnospiraceae bacterium]|nr:DNA polymerase III subunit delta [Lachnospiraceae bacterium]